MKAEKRRAHIEPDKMLICPRCAIEKPHSDYYYKEGVSKFGPCRECRSALTLAMRQAKAEAAGRVLRRISELNDLGQKQCRKCQSWLPLSCFQVEKGRGGVGGVTATCKRCKNALCRDWAKLHPKRTRSLEQQVKRRVSHRLHVAKRQKDVAARSDSTVSMDFMIGLYATESCYYCEKTTPQCHRTADHKVPLFRGGTHVATNLVMACRTCNCRKNVSTEEEFRERTRNDNLRNGTR